MVIFGAAMGMSDDAGGDRDPEDGGDRADSGAGGDPGHAGAPPPEVVEMMARLQANTEFFLGYEVPGFSGHTRISQRCGPPPQRSSRPSAATRRANLPHQAALALAERLGVDAVVLPGGHGVSVRTPTDTRSNCGNCLTQADQDGTTTRPWSAGYWGRRCTTSAAE
jgi:hypothetical protein